MEKVNFQNSIQEKQVSIDNLKINYKIIGDGDIPIILLHGWGLDSNKYLATAKYLLEVESEKLKVKSYCIYLLDLPGFGKSDMLPEAWGVDEYVELVRKIIDALQSNTPSNSPYKGEDNMNFSPCYGEDNMNPSREDALNPSPFRGGKVGYNALEKYNNKVILIGHSFGGRIAIKFAAKYPEKLKALILTGAAGIKHKPAIKQQIFFILAKAGKAIFSLPFLNLLEKPAQKLLYRAAREKDYYAARGVMRETFKKIIDEDLTGCLGKISTSTLLVWGRNDRSTPLADGQLMSLKIESAGGRSKLKIIDDANHSLPYQIPEKFAKIVSEFIMAPYRRN